MTLLLDTQQQPGPDFGQQLVQKVIHVQSTSFPPGLTFVAQSEYGLAETVPGKSIPPAAKLAQCQIRTQERAYFHAREALSVLCTDMHAHKREGYSQLKCGVFGPGSVEWLPTIQPYTVGCPPVTWPSLQCNE